MICLHCTQVDLKANPTLSREGFAACKQEPAVGRYVSLMFERVCLAYERAGTEVVQARDAWNKKRST
jgi:hypothetical protein